MSEHRQPDTQIPPGAIWNGDQHVWEICGRNQDGQRQGDCRWLREDGSLREVGSYEADVRDGPFVVYHPNGQVARQGSYRAGLVHGTLSAHASDAPTNEVLRACCVPPAAWEMRALYAGGEVLHEVFRDREGRPLLEDGAPRPDPPAGISADAEWDEAGRRWVSGSTDTNGNRTGTFRFWTRDGRLVEESEYRDGLVNFTRVYAEDGEDGHIVEECHFVGERQPHGGYRRCFPPEESPYADSRIREERGEFDRGRRVGSWSFLDAAGRVVATVELGLSLDEDHAKESPAFSRSRADSGSPEPWADLAKRLGREGRVREALCAAARGAARRGDAAELSAFLSKNTLLLEPKVRQQRGEELAASSTETLTSALEALVTGSDGAAVFRTLGSVLDRAHPAALDFVNASLLLAPEHHLAYLTRALIRIEQGDDRGALADATRVAVLSPAAAESLREHVRIAFPDFSSAASFWPALEIENGLPPENGAQGPAQTLSAVRHLIQVYATRLYHLRAAVRARVAPRVPDADPTWIPPDTSALLPDGPVQLRQLTIAGAAPDDTDVDDGNAGEIRIDEALSTDGPDESSVADLLNAARATSCAMGWLCWACGLDRVGLPDDLRPPPPDEFGAAVAMSVARCFRAHDRVITGGVRGLAEGLPGFVWEGMDIDRMPSHFARIAAAEYLEIRSMFLWLVLPDAVSPFQSDLREA